MHRQMPAVDQKKPISLQKHAPSFVHLKVESHCSVKVAPTCQDLEQDSETGSQILLLCMKRPHNNPNFFENRDASEMCPSLGNAFQTLPSCWLVQLLHACVREPSTSSKRGWSCTLSSKGDFGAHATLLQTPTQYLKWNISLMVTQGTKMGIYSKESI